jgi:hypothetical protein
MSTVTNDDRDCRVFGSSVKLEALRMPAGEKSICRFSFLENDRSSFYWRTGLSRTFPSIYYYVVALCFLVNLNRSLLLRILSLILAIDCLLF